MRGKDGQKYRIQVSIEDCTGCGLCVEACPAKDKALVMSSYESQKEQAMNWAFAMTLRQKENPAKPGTVMGTQFNKPLLEFSGACAGCGETPYVKLLTQMFGDRMMIANATGCSSIWGGAAPVSPYTTNDQGQGPAWSNSLFEDNAEFGYGMFLANQTRREALAAKMQAALITVPIDLQGIMQDWIDHREESAGSQQRAAKLQAALQQEIHQQPSLQAILDDSDLFVKPSQWMIGGDGWAYDIGFGGIDHVLASGADVNILVLDNEVYSNTGGQVSKATPTSAIAKFAASGKYVSKKIRDDGYDIWSCIRGANCFRSQSNADDQSFRRSGEIPWTISDHCLYTMYHPWISRWHETIQSKKQKKQWLPVIGLYTVTTH